MCPWSVHQSHNDAQNGQDRKQRDVRGLRR